MSSTKRNNSNEGRRGKGTGREMLEVVGNKIADEEL